MASHVVAISCLLEGAVIAASGAVADNLAGWRSAQYAEHGEQASCVKRVVFIRVSFNWMPFAALKQVSVHRWEKKSVLSLIPPH
jgi:hypothetical protein